MPLRNDEQRFGSVAKGFHWTVVALVVVMFGLGWYMDDLPLGPDKVKVYNWHKSFGVTVLALMLLRLLWRQVSPPPPLPAHIPPWQRLAAHGSHALLYLLLLAQPTIGLLHAWSANFPVVVFGVLPLPSLTAPDEARKELMGALHWAGTWLILIVVAVHVAAALHHHLVRKDDVLRRMLPGVKV